MSQSNPSQQYSIAATGTLSENPLFRALAGGALLFSILLAVYWPAINGQFILDDDLLLTYNNLVKAPDGLYRIWFTSEAIDYWPITNSSFWLQWRLWQINPTGYHAVNLLLHFANCLLLWRLLLKLEIPGAFFAALLFAIHPVNVESVAWISQLKNLLSLLFFLLSILWFVQNQTTQSSTETSPAPSPSTLNRWYWLSLLAFILAMLSKGSVATLPIILLIILWWQQRLTVANILQTVPFFLVAGVLTVVNIWFQHHGSDTAIRSATFAQRLADSGAVVWFYLSKAFLPLHLAFVYPQWETNTSDWRSWIPLAALVAFTTILLLLNRKPYSPVWIRHLLFAWCVFLSTLIPVLGFVDVGYMKFSLVADHYQYISIICLISLFAAAMVYAQRRVSAAPRTALKLCSFAIVAAFAVLTFRQTQLYANPFVLDTGTLEENPGSWLIHTNLSINLADTNQLGLAIDHAQEAIRLQPDFTGAHMALATALSKDGRTPEALDEFEKTLTLDPQLADSICSFAASMSEKKNPEAIQILNLIVKHQPEMFQARFLLGHALAVAGRFPESLQQLQLAAQLRPDSPDAYIGLMNVYSALNQSASAAAAAKQGLELARSSGKSSLVEQFEAWLSNHHDSPSSPSAQ